MRKQNMAVFPQMENTEQIANAICGLIAAPTAR